MAETSPKDKLEEQSTVHKMEDTKIELKGNLQTEIGKTLETASAGALFVTTEIELCTDTTKTAEESSQMGLEVKTETTFDNNEKYFKECEAEKDATATSVATKSRTSSTSSGSSKPDMKTMETSPKERLEGRSTFDESEDATMKSKRDVQNIYQTEMKETFESATAGVSLIVSTKIDLLEEDSTKIKEESQKMDVELKADTKLVIKDQEETSTTNKSRTSSTSSGSSKKEMIVKTTETTPKDK